MIHEGGARHWTEVAMLSRSQERLLRYLGSFPASLETAWDLPRDVSLPGLADAMGVVRSGLNQPLNDLMSAGYIVVRVAHVTGGGARRRQVYHITEAGRAWLLEHPEQDDFAELVHETPAAEGPVLLGRSSELNELAAMLAKHGKAAVGGLSGVGKTTLVRSYAPPSSVRWAQIDEFSDMHAVLRDWYSHATALPTDMDAVVDHVRSDGEATLFVVDDLHRLASRHHDSMVAFLHAIHQAGLPVVIVGRLPLPEDLEWPLLRLSTLAPEDAQALLGEHLDDAVRLDVAKALDGHPMALQLYQEGDPLPEAGEDIQAFVEHTMLNTLSEDERHALDRMVLFPRPILTEKAPGNECVAELDERALLRWSDENTRCEVQHLVRNVRRTMLSEGSLRALHEEAVVHWKQHADDPAYAVLLLYHKLALDNDDLAEVMEDEFDRLVASQGAALATIFERATTRRPEDEQLQYWAGRIALQRHEHAHARGHIERIESEHLRDELAYQLALLEGDEDEAHRLLGLQLTRSNTQGRGRLLLHAAVQRLEDRIFDEPHALDKLALQRLLNQVELPEAMDLRASMTVSMSLVQHTLALLDGDEPRATSLVEGLEAISHEADPIVLHMHLKTQLCFQTAASSTDLQAMAHRAMDAQPTPFHRAVVGLTYAEHLVRNGNDAAAAFFAKLPTPDGVEAKGNPHARYAARWWYLNGHLDAQRSAMALRESSRWFRQAGCHHAARSVAKRLHRLL